MILKPEQIKRFKDLHSHCEWFNQYSDEQITEIANGVANYYLTLFKINQRLKKEGQSLDTSPRGE